MRWERMRTLVRKLLSLESPATMRLCIALLLFRTSSSSRKKAKPDTSATTTAAAVCALHKQKVSSIGRQTGVRGA